MHDGEFDGLGQNPRSHDGQGHKHRGQLGDIAQGLLLDLSRGLENADDKADQHAGQHRSGRQQQDQHQSLSQYSRDCINAHWRIPYI